MVSRSHKSAKKSLGQNFLSDPSVVEKIVSAVEPLTDETVVEIGPGRGALTAPLIASGAKVFSIELDTRLVAFLREKFGGSPNFEVLEADALAIDLNMFIGPDTRPVKLAANLPYYISTAILQRFIEQRACFSSLVLMFQLEVVNRIIAKPGESERGFLTVAVESTFNVEKLFEVPPTSFQPRPKVWSSVIRLTPTNRVRADARFRDLLSAGFSMKRKTIANNLKMKYPNFAEALDHAGIDPRSRAEDLNLDQWSKLDECIRALR